MTRWLYSLLLWLAQPLLRRKLKRRGRQEPGYLQAMDERFGRYGSVPSPRPDPESESEHGSRPGLVWIHAVSLGETRAAAVLLAALRLHMPGMRLLLTHGTATGRAEGIKLLQAGDVQAWLPWDTPGAVQRFLRHFKPRIGLLMETEVWPNLVQGCHQHAVPLLLVNARLSDKSLRQAQRLVWLARPAFAGLTAVWAQTAADAARLSQLGAKVAGVAGNLKFDAAPNAAQLEIGRGWRAALAQSVLMLASSREGEEQALLQIFKAFQAVAPVSIAQKAINNIASQSASSGEGEEQALLPFFKDFEAVAPVGIAQEATNNIANRAGRVQWLIVPRHPQRFEAVAALIEAEGFAVSRRSGWGADGPIPAGGADTSDGRPVIWLGDSLGEMALYYALADVALLGGSFAPLGGQNLIEAAACGCPVVMGPHTFNFEQAAEQAAAAGAAQRVANLEQGVTVATKLALDIADLPARRLACSAFAQAHRGAASRLAQAIARVCAGPPVSEPGRAG